MRRPLIIWLIFGTTLCVAVAAMGWTTAVTIRLNRAEVEARRNAAIEEDVRLALWRMDSALAPFLMAESGKPFIAWSPLYRADGAIFEQGRRPGERLVPSPLLGEPSEFVRLYFQINPDRSISSPQAPTGDMRLIAQAFVEIEEIVAAEKELAELKLIMGEGEMAAMMDSIAEPHDYFFAAAFPGFVESGTRYNPEVDYEKALPRNWGDVNLRGEASNQAIFNVNEYKRRVDRARSNTMSQQEIAPVQQIPQQRAIDQPGIPDTAGAGDPLSATSLEISPMNPFWIGENNLILARKVRMNGEQYIQGALLDWLAIKLWLEREVADLLPDAVLEPAGGTLGPAFMVDGVITPAPDYSRRLAGLPARIDPRVPAEFESPLPAHVKTALALMWGSVGLAVAATGILLLGVMVLSERRATFVSAVTHELRTPLTTFRLYSDLLAGGMVSDSDKRQRYLETLRSESERLSKLVENVLSYARLEKNGSQSATSNIVVGEMLDRISGTLAERARQADMELEIDIENAAEETVRADVSSVEQILFNLVDNSCKYAANSADRRIHLRAERDGGRLHIYVEDHGPGIDSSQRGRLFRSFSKSSAEAAESAPGVGLGLALSRRLARRMGGELSLADGEGASFRLALRRATD